MRGLCDKPREPYGCCKMVHKYVENERAAQAEKEFRQSLFRKFDELYYAIQGVKLHNNEIAYRTNILDPVEILRAAVAAGNRQEIIEKMRANNPKDVLIRLRSQVLNPPSIVEDMSGKESTIANFENFAQNVRSVTCQLIIYIGLCWKADLLGHRYTDNDVKQAEQIGNDIEKVLQIGFKRIRLLKRPEWWPNAVQNFVTNHSQYSKGQNLARLFADLHSEFPIFKWAVVANPNSFDMLKKPENVTSILIKTGTNFLGFSTGWQLYIARSDPLDEKFLEGVKKSYAKNNYYPVGDGGVIFQHPNRNLPFFVKGLQKNDEKGYYMNEFYYDKEAFVEDWDGQFVYIAGGGTVNGTCSIFNYATNQPQTMAGTSSSR